VRLRRVYADSDGESHSSEEEVDLAEVNYAPPAPPLWASAFFPAVSYQFLRTPPGWYGDWHPAPRRQVLFFLKGEVEAETSDGNRARSGPGDVVLLEDTSGKGHRSWVVGDEELWAAVIVLPD